MLVTEERVEQVLPRREPPSATNSERLYQRAQSVLPAGVSSNMRAIGFEPSPIFMKSGRGSRLVDVDDREYIDYLLAYGCLILGHSHERIREAVTKQLNSGFHFATTTELEIEVAENLQSIVPCAEQVRFCVTGTEATMDALRLARAATGKDKIIKFEGHYHGGHDYGLISYGAPAGLETKPARVPAAGVPDEITKNVILVPWNNPKLLEKTIRRHREEIAAIITEPIMADSGVILPEEGYLKFLREISTANEILLIFDEVITGFRVALGGAQEYYGVTPDLATYSKALGGGFPIAAICGKKEYMQLIGPGKVFHGGTFNAHPISLTATSVVIDELKRNAEETYERMYRLGEKLRNGLAEIGQKHGWKLIAQGLGPMFQIFFTDLKKVRTYRDTLKCDFNAFKYFTLEMIKRGVYIHPSGFERWTLSTAHTEEDVRRTLAIAEDIFRELEIPRRALSLDIYNE